MTPEGKSSPAVVRRVGGLIACAVAGCFEPSTGALPTLPKEGVGVWFISGETSTRIVELDRDEPAPFDDLSVPKDAEVELWFYGCTKDKLEVPSPGSPPFSKVQSGVCGEPRIAPCPFDQYRLTLGDSRFDPIALEPITADERSLQPWPESSRPPSPCLDFSPVITTVLPDVLNQFAEPTVLEVIADDYALVAIRDRSGTGRQMMPRGIVQIWKSPQRKVGVDGKLEALVAPTLVTSSVTADIWLGGTALPDGGVFLVGDLGQTVTVHTDGSALRIDRGAPYPLTATRCRGRCSHPSCGLECGAQPCYATCIRNRACLDDPAKDVLQRDRCVDSCVEDCDTTGDDTECFATCLRDPVRCEATVQSVSVVGGDKPDDPNYQGPELWIGSACGALLKQVGTNPWEVVRSSTTTELNEEGAELLWSAPGDVYGAGILPINMLHHEPNGSWRSELVGEAEGLVTTAVVKTKAGIFSGGFFPLLGSYLYERLPAGWTGKDMVGSEDPVVKLHEIPGGMLVSVDSSAGLFQYGPQGICPMESVPEIPISMIATRFLRLNDHHLVVLVPVQRDDRVMPLIGAFADSVTERCDLAPN